MKFIDPIHWIAEDKDSGVAQIKLISDYFEAPLLNAGFQRDDSLKEWKKLKRLVTTEYENHPVRSLWKVIFKHKIKEFPNICLLASLIMSISGSNSEVERTFSIVTNILADKRLSMNHDTLADCVIILGNKSLWSKDEYDNIIDLSLLKYLKKRRKSDVGYSNNKDKIATIQEIPTCSDTEDIDSEDDKLVDSLKELII
jgi:hypothetical protein